jgi:hypothetical protein
MIIGQTAGVAATMAIKQKVPLNIDTKARPPGLEAKEQFWVGGSSPPR